MPWHFPLNKSVHRDTKAIQPYCNHKIALSSSSNTSVTYNSWRNLFCEKGPDSCSVPMRWGLCGRVRSLAYLSNHFLSEDDWCVEGEDLVLLGDSVNVVYISCCHAFHYGTHRKDRRGTRLYDNVISPVTFGPSPLLYHSFTQYRRTMGIEAAYCILFHFSFLFWGDGVVFD